MRSHGLYWFKVLSGDESEPSKLLNARIVTVFPLLISVFLILV